MYISNEEVFVVDYNNDPEKKILYAPLRSYMALISTKHIETFLRDSASAVRAQIMKRIISRPLIDLNKMLIELRTVTQELSIPITDNCNLHCSYCHASAGEADRTETMNKPMIDVILKCYFKEISPNTKSVKLNFTGGGEPTYKFATLSYAIRRATEVAAQHNITCAFTMATNGCYGQKIREYVINNFSEVSLSFDGPALIQNLHRPLANGQPSFDCVYETAKQFYKARFPFAIRATVSDYSLNYLTDIIDFFEQNFPDINLGLEPLVLVGRATKDTRLKPPDATRFGDELVRIFKYAETKRIQITNSASSEYNLVRAVFCSGVGIPNWTVLMNGDIVCCSRDGAPKEFTFGHLNFGESKIVIDEAKLNNIRNMNVFSYEECKDCFAKYHCAGDCPDRRVAGKSDCKSLRNIGQYILNKKINA